METASEPRALRDLGELAAERSSEIEKALAAARELLEMDLAYVAEFHDGHQVFRALEGDAQSFGVEEGGGIPLGESFCQRVVDGRIPNVIADAQGDDRVRDLPVTREAGIGAYIGVPVEFSTGRVYGTLCCLSHSRDGVLGPRDIRFMQVLARMVGDQLERQELERANRELAQEKHRLEVEATGVGALLAALEARDNYTGSHSEAVVDLAIGVARELGLSQDEIVEVGQVALLHDIGKIAVPDFVLRKEGPLDQSEWEAMYQHPDTGARMVASIESLAHLAPAIRAEHERWDGTGYPAGLAGEEIPLAARITFACDAYHAMTSDRPYRRALPPSAAVEELQSGSGTQFCPTTVEVLVRLIDRAESAREDCCSLAEAV